MSSDLKNILLFPLTPIYWSLQKMHMCLHTKDFIKRVHLNTPVISVGNLSSGGSGKTPIVDLLLSHFEEKGIRAGLVSKNYKAQISESGEVILSHPEGARYYGDEPFMLKMSHPNIPVWVGPNKAKSALQLEEKQKPDVILLDDGFQHYKLNRTLDILVLDLSVKKELYKILPSGILREGFRSLGRAQVIILNRYNLADSDTLSLILENIKRYSPNALVLKFGQEISLIKNLDTGLQASPKELEHSYLVSGIGRPEQFETQIKEKGISCKEHLVFKDHYYYTPADFRNFKQEDKILITAKDAVKIKLLDFRDTKIKKANFYVCELSVKPLQPLESLYAIVDKVIRKTN